MTAIEFSEKMEKMVARITVLREICEAKDTLFGPFTPERTMQSKSKVWNEILDKAKSLGLIAASRDYKYMRDVYWQNTKRYSLNRRENELIHGKKFERTLIDDLVYEIVDNTSSLHLQTSSKEYQKSILTSRKADRHHAVMLKTDDVDFELINDDENGDGVDFTIEEVDHLQEYYSEQSSQIIKAVESKPAHHEATPKAPLSPRSNDVKSTAYEQNQPNNNCKQKQKLEEGRLKKRKIQLEIDFLELQNYKTQLEVLHLERKLNIKPSEFTKQLVNKRKKTGLVFEKEDDDSDCSSSD